jgi:hypothetical protein
MAGAIDTASPAGCRRSRGSQCPIFLAFQANKRTSIRAIGLMIKSGIRIASDAAVLAVSAAWVLRGAGGGRAGSRAALGKLFTEVERPDKA